MRKIDQKYHVEGDAIVKSTNGTVIPLNEPLILFRAKDRLALPMLQAYLALCINDGCNDYQIEGIKAIIEQFSDFQSTFPEVMKQPGLTRGL